VPVLKDDSGAFVHYSVYEANLLQSTFL
jgi:hypothetical protein